MILRFRLPEYAPWKTMEHFKNLVPVIMIIIIGQSHGKTSSQRYSTSYGGLCSYGGLWWFLGPYQAHPWSLCRSGGSGHCVERVIRSSLTTESKASESREPEQESFYLTWQGKVQGEEVKILLSEEFYRIAALLINGMGTCQTKTKKRNLMEERSTW